MALDGVPGPFLVPLFTLSERRFSQKWLLASVTVTITIFHSFSLVFAANMTA